MKITDENKVTPIFRVLYIVVSLLAWFAVFINISSTLKYDAIFSLESLDTVLITIAAILLSYAAILGRAPEWLYRKLANNNNVNNNKNS